jgi:hypothetical protein
MRYVLMALGVGGLALAFLMFANARRPEHTAQATLVAQLGGIVLAIGMATTDIVEAIKSSRRS